MRIIFMGTPDFAVPSLSLLAQRHEVTLVVTRPDAVRSRGKRLEPSPVKVKALELGIPVLECTRVTDDVLARLRAEEPDVICVVAFGCLLPDAVLELAPLGCVNVHGSLLPKWRGAAPIQRAVLEGDEHIGISIMRLVQKMDAGDYCRQASVELGEKGCAQVMDELARGVERGVVHLARHEPHPGRLRKPQVHAEVGERERQRLAEIAIAGIAEQTRPRKAFCLKRFH